MSEKVVTLRMPAQLYAELSRIAEKEGFMSVSEAVREAVRLLILLYQNSGSRAPPPAHLPFTAGPAPGQKEKGKP